MGISWSKVCLGPRVTGHLLSLAWPGCNLGNALQFCSCLEQPSTLLQAPFHFTPAHIYLLPEPSETETGLWDSRGRVWLILATPHSQQ